MSITFTFRDYEAKIEKPPMPDGNRLSGPQKLGKFSGRAIIARTAPGYRGEAWVLLLSLAKTASGDELQEKQEADLVTWLHSEFGADIMHRLDRADEERGNG